MNLLPSEIWINEILSRLKPLNILRWSATCNMFYNDLYKLDTLKIIEKRFSHKEIRQHILSMAKNNNEVSLSRIFNVCYTRIDGETRDMATSYLFFQNIANMNAFHPKITSLFDDLAVLSRVPQIYRQKESSYSKTTNLKSFLDDMVHILNKNSFHLSLYVEWMLDHLKSSTVVNLFSIDYQSTFKLNIKDFGNELFLSLVRRAKRDDYYFDLLATTIDSYEDRKTEDLQEHLKDIISFIQRENGKADFSVLKKSIERRYPYYLCQYNPKEIFNITKDSESKLRLVLNFTKSRKLDAWRNSFKLLVKKSGMVIDKHSRPENLGLSLSMCLMGGLPPTKCILQKLLRGDDCKEQEKR